MTEIIINEAKQEAERLADLVIENMTGDSEELTNRVWDEVYAKVLALQLGINL